MKKNSWIAMICLLLVCSAGCETVQRKFTRKSKSADKARPVVYFEEGVYQKKYSNAYYYKTHYTQWKSWQSELLKELGGNRKRMLMSAEESVNHLQEMKRNLLPEKQVELAPFLDSLTKITDRMRRESFADPDSSGVRTQLEYIQRRVEAGFHFDKVEAYVIPDKVEI